MNKLMIVVGMLGSMSLPTPKEVERDGTQVYNNVQIAWSIENIEDLQQFVGDDLYNGEIDQEIGENYYEILEETRRWLVNWYQDNQ
jgi:predicted transcriptional regulator